MLTRILFAAYNWLSSSDDRVNRIAKALWVQANQLVIEEKVCLTIFSTNKEERQRYLRELSQVKPDEAILAIEAIYKHAATDEAIRHQAKWLLNDLRKDPPSREEFLDVVDVAIITVLPEEYDAVCSKIEGLKSAFGINHYPNLYAWKVGEIPSSRDSYSVVVGMTGRAGTSESALATLNTIQRWMPRYVFFVGIAGGLSDLGKGDVVIADVIHGYEYGKVDKKFIPRDNWTYKTDIGLLTGAIVNSHSNWRDLIPVTSPRKCTPTVTYGEIASGDKVIDDPTNDFFAEVLEAWPKIKAVEMEGAGVGNAIENAQAYGHAVSFMMIRGISDLPRHFQKDEKARKNHGTRERDAWKVYASHSAAAFTISFIAAGLPVSPRHTEGSV